jgi:arylsulfatase
LLTVTTLPTARRTAPASAVALGLLLLATACGGEDAPPPRERTEAAPGRPRNVLLISVDTWRADHCSMFGYEKPTTPFLDSLAERGVLFENHMTNSNNTLVSHTTMLTGLTALAHGTFDSGTPDKRQALAPGFRTLAELFSDEGYATAAFTEHETWLNKEFGLGQGFDVMESVWTDARTNMLKYLDWHEDNASQPTFAFLHFYDPHSEAANRGGILPYDSSPDLIKQFAGEQPEGFTGCLQAAGFEDHCTSRYLAGINDAVEELPPEHLTYLKGLYDAGLRKMDMDLEYLFGELERRGVLKDTMVVITSDHGEAFFEKGQLLHGGWGDPVMHIPLIIVLPENMEQPTSSRVDALTQGIDVAPTILDLCDINSAYREGLAAKGQGQSLVPAMRGGHIARENPEELFFIHVVLRSRDEVSRYKYLYSDEQSVFYDLDADPDERNNLLLDPEWAAANAERVEGIRVQLWERRDQSVRLYNAVMKGNPVVPVPEMTDEQVKDLENLGYFDGADEEK